MGMIALVVAVGVAIFVLRERGAAPNVNASAEEARKANAAIEPRYEEARQKLLAGQPAEAAEAFHALEQQPNVPQPTRNWITVHIGMAELLAGRESEARSAFRDLEARGVYSSDAAEGKLAQFFVDLGRTMSSTGAVDASVAKDYDKSNHEAIALFLLALKDWNARAFEEAGPLFRQFQSSPLRKRDPSDPTPPSPYAWIGDYKDLAAGYIADFVEYRSVAELLKETSTLAAQKKALEEARAVRGRLKLPGTLADFLDKTIKELDEQVSKQEAEQERITQEHNAADAKIFAAILPKVNALNAQFRFAEARVVIQGAKLTGEKGRREQEALLKKTDWLAKFKSLLMRDLNASGFPQSIAKRNGMVIAGGVGRASEQQVEVKTPYGTVPVPWTDLTMESVIAMAQSFIRPGLPEDLAGDRKWLLGVFSFHAQKLREGRTLLAEAAQVRPEYGEALPLFLEFSGNQ